MKRKVKKIAVLLILTMILTVFASCSATDIDPLNSGEGSSEAHVGGSDSQNSSESLSGDQSQSGDDPEKLPDFLPPQIDLDREMTILAETLYQNEWLDSDNGKIVGHEVYGRKQRVEERLGIELHITLVDSGMESAIKEYVTSADVNKRYDLISAKTSVMGNCVLNGVFFDLSKSSTLDLSSPWWPDALVEGISVKDKMYFISGDISPTLTYEQYAVVYNADLIGRFGLDDPLKLVEDREWTVDKLIEMTSGIYSDLDDSIKGPSKGDLFAITIHDDAHMSAIPFGMGLRVLLPRSDRYAFSDDYLNFGYNYAQKLQSWIRDNDGVKSPGEFKDYGVSFADGNSIFSIANVEYVLEYLREADFGYMMVPCPIMNKNQERYLSYFGAPCSFWAIPTDADIDESCTLLEYLGADAYAYITPAIYEDAAAQQKTEEGAEKISEMLTLIRDGLVCDPIRFYKPTLATSYQDFSALDNDTGNWQSYFTSYKITTMQESAKDLFSKLNKIS